MNLSFGRITAMPWNRAAVAPIAVASTVTSLGNGFTYDDIPIIATNARLYSLSSWWTLFGMSYWPPSYGESLHRPLSMLSYAVQGSLRTVTAHDILGLHR